MSAGLGGDDVVVVLAVLVTLAVTATLSAFETVMTRLSVVRALRLSEEQERAGQDLLWLVERRATTLSVVLLSTIATRLALVALVAARAAPRGPSVVVGAIVVVGVVSLVLTEVAPRTLALRDLERAALRLAPAGRAMVRVVAPLSRFVNFLGRATVRTREDVSGPFADDEELEQLLAAHEEDVDHHLEPDERAMIRSIIELGDTVVREIMVPRPDMVTVARDAPMGDVVRLVIEHGYSRLPVTGDSSDEVLGTVHAKDVLRRLSLDPDSAVWDDLVRDPTFVPEVQRTDDLLRTLREAAVHQAIVIDEYGAVAGLVTIEDILEEIVGEIVDEHDHEEPLVTVLDDGGFAVDGRLPMDDFNELLGSELPDEGWDTVGGLVVGVMGRIPDAGEQVEVGGVALEVARVQGRRIAQVTARATDATGDDGEEPDAAAPEHSGAGRSAT